MNSISANLNVMIKASEKASKILIRDFGELEKLQVSKKGPRDFVTNADIKVEKIIITASGGPFLKWPISKIKKVSPEKALKHPNWSKGKKNLKFLQIKF